MSLSDPSLLYKLFVDEKFIGIEKLNDCYTTNISSLTKLIRIFKDHSVAQDIYSKSILKSNVILSQLTKNKLDCFNPILEVLSAAFSSFATVQREYSDSLSILVKKLTSAFENSDENSSRVLSTRDLNVISNFKNSQLQLTKARSKYISTIASPNDGSNNDEKSERSNKRLKDNYELSLRKYNEMRIHFFDVMRIGFDRSKDIQLNHLDTMRKLIKNVGNALAKMMSDMKESVDLMKTFYKTKSKEALFQIWIDSNKTVEDASVELFPMMVLDSSECVSTDNILIDIDTNPQDSHASTTNTSEGKRKKVITVRRNTDVETNNVPNIIDQDIPDITNTDTNKTSNKKMFEKNVNTTKSAKNKFKPLIFFKKFQSTNDLTTATENKDSTDEDLWQSKSNLNENVAVDDEGFIIRDTQSATKDTSSSSSSDGSYDNRLKGIKIAIRPFTKSTRRTASKSEVINAAMQLPTPTRDKVTGSDARRVFNLQRLSRPVTDIDKDRYSRRSMSVSEITFPNNCVGTTPCVEEKALKGNAFIPIASAMTEILTSNDGGCNYSILGQLVLAWPLYIKDHLQSSMADSMPREILFEFISDLHTFSTTQIFKQYKDVARLENINSSTCRLIIHRELLQRIISDQTLMSNGSRISFPILEYSTEINDSLEKIIECNEQWCSDERNFVQFSFTLASKHMEKNKDILVHIKLLSEGSIDCVSSNSNRTPEVHNPRFWSIKYGKPEHSVTVKIKNNATNVVRLKLGYEFIFENFSLISPSLNLVSNINDNSPTFKISLIHYRTISNGAFSQLFHFNIS